MKRRRPVQKMLNGSQTTKSLESATRKKIDTLLNSLGWITDDSPNCNVFTERAKTEEQNEKLLGNKPDYLLYQSGTDIPIAVIETKRKGHSLNVALNDGINKYALPLGIPLVFATDGTLYKTWHVMDKKKELSIDNQIVIELFSEKMLLRFIREGASISEVSKEIKHTREELLKIFKWTNDLLRKEGLREGIERFTEFSNILFLKLISEMEEDRDQEGEPRLLDDRYCWKSFEDLDGTRMLEYINGVILPYLVKTYNHSGDVFDEKLKIKPKTLKIIVSKIPTETHGRRLRCQRRCLRVFPQELGHGGQRSRRIFHTPAYSEADGRSRKSAIRRKGL